MEEVRQNKDGLNINVQRTDMAQFTGMARVQEFTKTVQSVVSMLVSVLMVLGILSGIGYSVWSGYQSSHQTAQVKHK